MRLHGQAQADQMRMRSLIQSGISTVSELVSDLDSSLSAVAKSGAYADLSGKPTLGALASQDAVTHLQVSDWSSATSSFLTEHQSLAAYAKKADLGDLASLDTIPHSKISDWASATSSFLTAHQDISGLLAKSGGTMSGAISISGAFSSGFVKQTVTDSYTMLSGGTTANNGAVLILSGGTRSTYGGMFRISARTSSGNKKDLDGWADGTLTWGGEKIAVASDLATKQDLLAVEEVPLTFPKVTEFSARDITCYRYGKVVMLNIHVTLSAAMSAATVVATGLPLPARETRQVVCTWASSYRRPIRARITAAGELTFQYGYATMYSHTLIYLAA